MFSHNTTFVPRTFAGRILLETVNFSPKTKAFLKEKAILTLQSLADTPDEAIRDIPCYHIKRELRDFKNRLNQWLDKQVTGLRFSRNIPPPPTRLPREQRATLIAMLLAEPFFGNRRKVSEARHRHLPQVYAPVPDHPRSGHPSAVQLSKLSLAS